MCLVKLAGWQVAQLDKLMLELWLAVAGGTP